MKTSGATTPARHTKQQRCDTGNSLKRNGEENSQWFVEAIDWATAFLRSKIEFKRRRKTISTNFLLCLHKVFKKCPI